MNFSFELREAALKHVEDYTRLAKIVEGHKAQQHRVVATIGTWDILHIGHVRYLMEARRRGDVLVVGVDSDRTVKLYKGALRPVVPYIERAEMLTYQYCVDLVTPVDDVDEKGRWQYGLLKIIRPDVFVAVEDSYPENQLARIRRYCPEVVVLPRQAENTSTSQMIQNTVKGHLEEMYKEVTKRV